MRALILIGGEGTRLRPLTLNTLKCAAPIVNRPFFTYQFNLLKKYGIKEVI
jgi:mannose-1-phosphate guanylyltransferase